MSFATNPFATPNRKAARAKATELVDGISSPSIPVTEIAESNGVNVVFADMGKFAEKVAGFIDFGSRRIYVNMADRPQRQRFTIAHELGHWLLHRGSFEADPKLYPVLPRFQSVDWSNAFEQEANAFAAELLVPERLLKQVSGAPTVALANVFDVSRAMIENRLKYLG